jgi:hypothetical protein
MAAFKTEGYLSTIGALTDVHTTQRNPLGIRAVGYDAAGNYAEYIYLAGVASLVVGDWVRYANSTANAVTQGYGTSRVNNDAVAGAVAVAMAAVLATQFGWFQIFGLATANVTSGSIDGLQLSLSATAGRCTAAITTTKVVYGATGVGTAASNVGTAFITYPYMFGADPL